MEDNAARFQRLIQPVHDRARAFARCVSRTHGDGDDLFQEALVRAMINIADLRADSAFTAWLYRIVINVHRNRCRRAFWGRFLPLGDTNPATDTDGEWAPDAGDSLDRVRRALSRLPAEQRETIVLHEVGGWQVDELAALYKLSPSAIKSRLARARTRLRDIYTRELAAEGVPSIAISGDTP
jgi:RNA polymerase sigma-70 factor (ECF subfamily)